ncbi:MECDP-synthase [Marinobacter lipolyticus]|uniref:MECDP-synthase n=1 Tax=Marinobacter lipolyticus TaxID=209639 RepID=UPI001BCF9CF9|nr:MECDP-synthase [Marinobacter lipolyticus]MBS8239684.1 MECDP-synthase [Marinobacter lipolyticus]
MFKKTLISLAVASSLGLTGCFDSASSGKNANPDYKITDTTIDTSLVRPIYNPNPLAAEPQFPINSDLILLLGATQSANYDFTGLSTGDTPADDAVNRLSGFSTSGAFSLKFDGELNPESVMANATVFLVPLKVPPAIESAPEALPNTNPSGIDPADPFELDPNLQPNFRADVVSLDGGTNNAIRVVPLEPLLEGQKYLVVVSDDVSGANGKPIDRAVQDVALADGTLGNPALGNVKTLLQSLDALGNGFLTAMGTGSESALSYSFTTNSDTDVLEAMMAPAAFGTALGQKVGFTAQLKAVRDNFPALNFSQLTAKLSELGEKAAAVGSGDLDITTLPAAEIAAITRLGELQAITTPANIEAAITAEVGDSLHLPVPRPSYFRTPTSASDLATIQGLAAQNPSNPIVGAAGLVEVSQGAIALPYFQSLPGSDGTGISTGSFEGSTSLEADLSESLEPGVDTFRFLRDIDGTLNVNGYFPFPEQKATTTVPVVAFQPTAGNPLCAGGPTGVTIFQHGITVDRSVAMLPGILLAAQACQVVIAIDQPLHGLAGETAGRVPGLTPLSEAALSAEINAILDGGGTGNPNLDAQLEALINADYIGERHFNYTANAQQQPVSADLADVASGSLFINPANMLNNRDNLRQGVVDLLNVAASVQTMGISGPASTGGLATLPVHFVGHSLGGISGTTFASLANDPTLNATLNGTYSAAGLPFTFPTLSTVVLHNTGGQVTRLIENSPAFSTPILGGLEEADVSQGSANFESFFYVFQSVVDATDPVNFAEALGGSTTNILISEVVGDTTVPNEANVNPLGDAFSAPLASTEPLMALIDLGADGGTLADGSGLSLVQTGSAANQGVLPAASFFEGANPCADANHGTFVGPATPANPEDLQCPGGTNTISAFSEMVRQTILAINGAPVLATTDTNADLTVLGSSDTLVNALDQDEAE